MLYGLLISLALLLLAVEKDLGFGLTNGRIGLITFFVALLVTRRWKNSFPRILIVPFYVLALYGLFLFLIYRNADLTIYRALIWILYSFLFYLSFVCLSCLSIKNYRRLNLILLFTVSLLFIYAFKVLVSNLGLGVLNNSSFVVRHVINTLPGGLSSYFFGVYALAILGFFLSLVHGRDSLAKYYIFALALVLVFTASRQFFIYYILSSFIYCFLVILKNPRSIFTMKIIYFIVIFLGFMTPILSQDFFATYLDRVFNFDASYSMDSNTSFETRANIIYEGIRLFLNNPFGYGPNAHALILERPPHNGYIAIAIDFGVVGLLVHLTIGTSIILKAYIHESKNFILFSSLFVPFYFASPMFNDVVYIAIYWVITGSMFSILTVNRVKVQ